LGSDVTGDDDVRHALSLSPRRAGRGIGTFGPDGPHGVARSAGPPTGPSRAATLGHPYAARPGSFALRHTSQTMKAAGAQ